MFLQKPLKENTNETIHHESLDITLNQMLEKERLFHLSVDKYNNLQGWNSILQEQKEMRQMALEEQETRRTMSPVPTFEAWIAAIDKHTTQKKEERKKKRKSKSNGCQN